MDVKNETEVIAENSDPDSGAGLWRSRLSYDSSLFADSSLIGGIDPNKATEETKKMF